MTEREVQDDIVRALDALGWDVTPFSYHRKMPPGAKGVADLYVTHEGHKTQVWIEVKSPGGALTPEQETWLTRTGASGAHVMVAQSVAEVIAKLADLGFVTE